MGRRHRHDTHFDTGEKVRSHVQVSDLHVSMDPVPLCRADLRWRQDVTTDTTKVSCGKCCAILGKQELARRAADQPRLALGERITESPGGGTYLPYRFMYPALVDGAHVAFVVFDGAYGSGSWRISAWSVDKGHPNGGVGYQLQDNPDARFHRALEYNAKEQALLAIPDLMKARPDEFRTVEQRKADRADWERDLAAAEKRETAERQAHQLALADAINGLKELKKRTDLTNFQQSAVAFAIDHLTKSDS